MPAYGWRNAKTSIELSRLIELLNEHFRKTTHLLGGLTKIGSGYRLSRFLDLPLLDEEPDAPAEGVRLYTVLDGGKTELRARFPTGASQTVATEP